MEAVDFIEKRGRIRDESGKNFTSSEENQLPRGEGFKGERASHTVRLVELQQYDDISLMHIFTREKKDAIAVSCSSRSQDGKGLVASESLRLV